MSESLKRNLVFLLVMIAILVGMYSIATWSDKRSWCENRDEYICSMLTHVKSHLPTAAQGTYTNSDNINAVWSAHEDNYEFTYLVNKKEVMRVIGTEDTMYVQDYSDNRWWKQPNKLVEQYNIKLPFDPQSYTQYLTDVLLDESTTYTPIQATTCLVQNCKQYLAINKNAGLELTLNINREDNTLTSISTNSAGSTETITIEYDELDSIEVPTTDIKIASSNQNIFLDLIYNLQPKIETTPDFVEQFEQQREQAERSGEADEFPNYIPPTSVPQQP